jgi:hypothetical protein
MANEEQIEMEWDLQMTLELNLRLMLIRVKDIK